MTLADAALVLSFADVSPVRSLADAAPVLSLADAALWSVGLLQAAALVASLAVVWLPWLRSDGTLPARPPAVYRRVHVLAHVGDADVADVEAFLDRLRALDYPTELVEVHLLAAVSETPGDVAEFLAALPEEAGRLRTDVVDVPGRRGEWSLDGGVPASPFDAAITSLSLPDPELVTVLAVDDDPPEDLFERAVAGLEPDAVDVVQAGRTAVTTDRSLLPGVTAAGLATWSGTVLPAGSVPVPPSGYVTTAGRLRSLRTQHPTTPVDVAARRVGLSVGVLPCLVGEPCPASVGAWLARWRERVGSFRRRVAGTDGVGRRERWRHPAVVLAVADTPLGAPLGVAAVVAARVAGAAVPWPVLALVAANVVGWGAWSARRLAAHRRLASGDESRAWLWTNPVVAVAGAVLWALALRGGSAER